MWGLHVYHNNSAMGHICNVAGIFVQGHMPIMWTVCIPVFLVTILIAESSYDTYILIYLSHVCTSTDWHMWHLGNILVFGTYMAIMFPVMMLMVPSMTPLHLSCWGDCQEVLYELASMLVPVLNTSNSVDGTITFWRSSQLFRTFGASICIMPASVTHDVSGP